LYKRGRGNLSNFYDNYVRLCAENNFSVSGAASAIGLSNAAANGWKNGKIPNDGNLEKLAQLFKCTKEDLLEEIKKAPVETDERTIANYELLNDTNRAIVDRLIADLLEHQ
jgi:transcriptional regulator with XRE-family HTH domain